MTSSNVNKRKTINAKRTLIAKGILSALSIGMNKASSPWNAIINHGITMFKRKYLQNECTFNTITKVNSWLSERRRTRSFVMM